MARTNRSRRHLWIAVGVVVAGTAVSLAALAAFDVLHARAHTQDAVRALKAGHAIENAFHLRRRRKRRELFGSTTEPYPEFYAPRPYSKSFVIHLDSWYAQAHPDEDFAETFAVWLGSRGRWRSRYRGWPALRKLEYVDGLMREIRGLAPLVRSREHTDSLPTLALTLRQYYRRKQGRLGRTRRGEFPR